MNVAQFLTDSALSVYVLDSKHCVKVQGPKVSIRDVVEQSENAACF